MAIPFDKLNKWVMRGIEGGKTHLVLYSSNQVSGPPYEIIAHATDPGEDPRAFVDRLRAENKWIFWGAYWLGADNLREQMDGKMVEDYGPECACGALAYTRTRDGVPTCVDCDPVLA